MIKTIFRNTFLVGISVLILCAALFFGVQYSQVQDQTYAALRQETIYAEQGLSLSGVDYLKTLDNTNRVTWIAGDGSVLYDSDYAMPVDNQLDCAEVQAALEEGEGQGTRRSDSSGKSTMYYAKRCPDGTVLRLSRPLGAVRQALIAVSPVFWVLVLVLLISGVLSFRAAKQIVRPINDMDLDHPETTYPELAPLVGKIQEQKMTIQEEVAQRESLRREFSANVSHELKTPLTSISGFAELIAEGMAEGEKAKEFSRDIYKESQRLLALIEDIIRLSKLDEEAVSPDHDKVDLYAVCSEVVDSLLPVAEKQMIDLQLTGVHAQVPGNSQLLSEMVYNLCDNAIKYNHTGGSVTVDVSLQDGSPRLSVSDTGIGIAPEHQKRVFERFYRVDKSHSKEIGGTGLGLSIVKHGAQYHGAQVKMESEPGIGTKIILEFPPSEE